MIENGTGGANTNLNGLTFERQTDLAHHLANDFNGRYKLTEYPIKKENLIKKGAKDYHYLVHDQVNDEDIGIVTKQFQFYNVLKQVYGIQNIHHKFWKPDEALFNFKRQTVFIVEKKYQNGSGSVDEKLFGFNAKRVLYQELFNRSWWLDGQTLDKTTGKLKKTQSVDYHDYFDSLRNNGVRIMFDHYEDWYLGLAD